MTAFDRGNHWEPGKLWSLLDMLRAYAYQFAGVAQYIKEIQDIGAPPTRQVANALIGQVTPSISERTKVALPAIKALCNWVHMPSVEAQIERISDEMKSLSTDAHLRNLVAELHNRLTDELAAQRFFHVSPEHTPYYETPMLFGEATFTVFKEAADDIEAAGKCIAFRQGTATVFHCMRVLETALKRFAKLLGIPYAPSWESYLSQIQTRIKQKHRTKKVSWKRSEPFYRDIAGDLELIKIAWRNPTMHIVRKYTPDEAEEVFRATRTFMNRLSSHLAEVDGLSHPSLGQSDVASDRLGPPERSQ